MSAKIISQKKFSKLVSSTGPLSQPPGALTRMSNLLFTQRGSLQVADGSSYLSPYATEVNPGFPLVEWLTAYANASYSQSPYLLAISQATAPLIPNVTGLTATPTGSTTNPAGRYAFGIVALGSASGNDHTAILAPSAFVIINPASSFAAVNFTWTPQAGVYGYAIYTYPAGGGLFPPHPSAASLLATVVGASSSSYTFTGSVTPIPHSVFFNVNTTQYHTLSIFYAAAGGGTLQLYEVSAAAFPGVARQPASLSPADPGYNPAASIPGYSPYGGIAGAVQPIPLAVQFAGQEILILGNGYAPQAILPSSLASAVPVPLANTFQAAYPTWQSGVDWTTGSQLAVLSGSVNYLFTATQGGVSGSSAPTWNFATNAETSDNSVIWTSNGPIAASIAPLGAAHAVAYAGSLWLANTWVNNTQYQAWVASTSYSLNQQIVVYDGSGNAWLFTVQAGGVSGGAAPSWVFTVGSTTTDNTVTWIATSQPSPALVAGVDGPSCLKMSDANNPNSWNPVNTAFIAQNDGTQITGLQPFTIAALGISPTGSLCVFKEFTTYQVIGVFGSASFEIQPAQTNLGCLAARSIQFLPGFGVVRYSHLGFAVFDGINDRLISEDIRPYLFGGVDSEADLVPIDTSYLYLAQSAQSVSPPMYMCAMPLVGNSGALTRIFCYDLVMKSWAILDLPWAISALNTTASGEGVPVVLCGKTTGQVERMQTGDTAWDSNLGPPNIWPPISWSFRTPDVFGEGASQRLFYEQATITGYGSMAMIQSIVARLWIDGTNIGVRALDIVPTGDSTFTIRVSIFRNGYRAHLDISGNNGGAGGTIDAIDWAVTPKSALARRVIG
jgi:hypothetical protein